MGSSRDAMPSQDGWHLGQEAEDAWPGEMLDGGTEVADVVLAAGAGGESVMDDDFEDECLRELEGSYPAMSRGDEAKILALLRDVGATGPVWEEFATYLYRRAIRVLRKWASNGRICEMARTKSCPLKMTAKERRRLADDRRYRDNLVDHAVADAVLKLRKQILECTGWDPSKKASWSTYFIGGCVISFSVLINRQVRYERDNEPVAQGLGFYDDGKNGGQLPATMTEQQLGRSFPQPETVVINNAVIEEYLGQLEDRDRTIVLGKVVDLSGAEIAEILGCTPKAVERRWARMRSEHEWIARISLGSVRKSS